MKKLSLLGFLFFSGCIAVPYNDYSFGDFKVKTPKDMELINFSIETKGLKLKADKISSRNNPDVINSSADGQVKIIEATGKVAADVAGQVITAAAKAQQNK